jgi:hypothetical protein
MDNRPDANKPAAPAGKKAVRDAALLPSAQHYQPLVAPETIAAVTPPAQRNHGMLTARCVAPP